jgi:hypothetical protein
LKENSESFKTQKGFGAVDADVCAGGKAASWKALSKQHPSSLFQIQLAGNFSTMQCLVSHEQARE